MAQAVFDEHPLEEYLRESGESPLVWPGTTPELQQELDPDFGMFEDVSDDVDVEWCPRIILELLEILHAYLSPSHSKKRSNAFVERFKYNVISSSLLAPSPPSARPRHSPSIPGKLHVRACSMELDSPPPLPTPPEQTESTYGPASYTALCAAISLSIGYPFIAFLFLAGTFYSLYLLHSTTETSKHDMTSSFNALDDLITANNMWDSVIQDAITLLDNEERSSSGLASQSRIRVALLSCLQTTQTQCDSVRHIFSALTSPTELSQLAEMYAPPSPAKSELNLHTYSLTSPRSPLTPSPTSPLRNKRSTWNGSYSGLGYYGSPTSPIMRRRAKHRLNLSELFQDTNSAPGTPLSPVDKLDGESDNLASDHFGAAALDLQRSRRKGGLDALRSPPYSAVSPGMRQSMSLSSKVASSSRLVHSSLRQALEGALAAKRYACAHLLALRFNDDEDEGYWEDVRSMMGLLTSTLTDGYSRLEEAVADVEQENLRDQIPTPLVGTSPELERDMEAQPPSISVDFADLSTTFRRQKRASMGQPSFAPMPSHISKFAAHIAAISAALDDAREHLNQCVSALKDESADPFGPAPSSSSAADAPASSAVGATSNSDDKDGQEEEPLAVQAYERLRRELGLALRECERGREQLMTIVHPPPISSDGEAEADGELDDLPGLGHDGSDESDKADNPNSPSDDEGDARVRVLAAGDAGIGIGIGVDEDEDDASRHLLLAATAQHLPMPGIEEVFEAETGAKVVFTRERSKLSREERIRIAKARREAAAAAGAGRGLGVQLGGTGTGEHAALDADADAGDEGSPVSASGGGVRERWGPGGEVVQELKDVIWKVGERRRKMVSSSVSASSQAHVQGRASSRDGLEHNHLPPTAVATAVAEAAAQDMLESI